MPAETGCVLVTGAGGWIGACLVERLATDGRVEGLSRAELDCARRDQVDATLKALKPVTVVHLAGSTAHRLDPAATELHWRDTFRAGRNVLEASAACGVAHLIMAGTAEELGAHDGVLTTDLPASPRTTYGLCKSLVRDVARFVAHTADMRVDWFRPFIVYGPGQRGEMLVPAACAAAVLGRPTPFTDGQQQRDFLFVDDLLDWIALAVHARPEPNGDVNVHHLGTGTGVAVANVLEFIAKALPNACFEIGALPRRPHEPQVQIAPANPSADPVLGRWRATTPWKAGLRMTTQWWLSQS